MNKQTRNEKGFTMIELIVVVAIMGIIGAMLVPAFGTMSAKAKLSTDITTIKTLQRQIDLYTVEQTESPYDDTDGEDAKLTSMALGNLVDKGYLDTKDLIVDTTGTPITYDVQLKSGGEAYIQTALDGTSWVLKLDFTTVSTDGNAVTKYIQTNMDPADPLANWISGITVGGEGEGE